MYLQALLCLVKVKASAFRQEYSYLPLRIHTVFSSNAQKLWLELAMFYTNLWGEMPLLFHLLHENSWWKMYRCLPASVGWHCKLPCCNPLPLSFHVWKRDGETFMSRQSASYNASTGRPFMILLLMSKANIIMESWRNIKITPKPFLQCLRDLSPPYKNWKSVGNYVEILILLCEGSARTGEYVSSACILFALAHEIILASCLLYTHSPWSVLGIVPYCFSKYPWRLEQHY